MSIEACSETASDASMENHDSKPICLSLGSLTNFRDRGLVELPLDATVDDVIAEIDRERCLEDSLEGCIGFLAVERKDDDEEEEAASTGLASKLAADGGILLALGQSLAAYAIDEQSCLEVTLYGVFADKSRQPTVFKKDLEEAGFGGNIHKYVKLNEEDREIIEARRHFSSPLFSWLQPRGATSGLTQSIEFSQQDNFILDKPRLVLTVSISQDGSELIVTCTNLAGDVVCTLKLAACDIIAKLQSCICDNLQIASMTSWNGEERVLDSDQVSKYSLLTVEETRPVGHIAGCYQRHASDCHPAGYSASGSSSTDYIVLEPGRAGLQRYFKGDYKRAEELRKLVMSDAQWSIQRLSTGKEVVRILGKARLDRYFVHERSGHDGPVLSGYTCNCLVTIPTEQLLDTQWEEQHYASTSGSGWTCGSEDYHCSLFLPMPVLSALRMDFTQADPFVLQQALNSEWKKDYPYNQLRSTSRRGSGMPRVTKEAVNLLRHLRDNLKSEGDVSVEDIMQLQASVPKELSGEPAQDNEHSENSS